MTQITTEMNHDTAMLMKQWLIDNVGPETYSEFSSGSMDGDPPMLRVRGEGWRGDFRDDDFVDISFDKDEDVLAFEQKWGLYIYRKRNW